MFQINICRVCEKSTNLINISLPNNNNYVVQYLACANVSYELDDGLPPYLCRLCATQLNYAYNFKQKCEETEIKLKKMLSLSLETSEIAEECFDNLNEEDLSEEDLNEEDSKKLNESTSNADEASKISFSRCDICTRNQKFFSMHTLENHMRKKHGMQKNHRQCPKCFKWLKTYRYYIRHMKENKHSDNGEICQYCGKVFITWNIKRHIQEVHLNIRPFSCDICKKSFGQKTSVAFHMVAVHMKNYPCYECKKTFKSKSSLKQHAISHTPRDKQKIHTSICQICGKRFQSKAQCLLHESTHTGDDRHSGIVRDNDLYECDICKRPYHTKGNLKVHKLTHTGIKPHKCDICNRSFSLLYNLNRHTLTHTGEKPFKCNYCDKSFTQNCSLKAHIRTHTGEKPYKCQHCSKCFSDSSTWVRHKKVHIYET